MNIKLPILNDDDLGNFAETIKEANGLTQSQKGSILKIFDVIEWCYQLQNEDINKKTTDHKTIFGKGYHSGYNDGWDAGITKVWAEIKKITWFNKIQK